VSTAASTRARLASSVSNAPAAAERAVAARLDDRFHGLAADALERRERVVDRVALDVEFDAGAVDRGRLDLDAEA
jgi:hypothetical protein